MSLERQKKEAVVLSGGGAKGAYEIGVLRALAEGRSSSTDHRPLHAEVFTGTSVGAYNAAFLVAQAQTPMLEAVSRLETIWRERVANTLLSCGNGVFRLHDAPLNVSDPGCAIRPLEVLEQTVRDADHWFRYFAIRGTAFLDSQEPFDVRLMQSINIASLFSPEPLYDLIRETVDYKGLRASKKSLSIAATNWKEGSLTLFSRLDIADRVGPRSIAASAAIPGVFPSVEIDGVPFHDGGVLLNTPLRPAIRAGGRPPACDLSRSRRGGVPVA